MSAEQSSEPAISSNSPPNTDVTPSADAPEREAKPRRPKKKQACRFFATKKGQNELA